MEKLFKNRKNKAIKNISFFFFDLFRQRILSEKTTVEQLAYKCLPRELYDKISVSALAQNVLYPNLSAKELEQYDANY